MKRCLFPVLFAVLCTSAFSQKKSELLAQLQVQNEQIKYLEQEVTMAKRKVSSSQAEAEALKSENTGLRDANASLLRNLGSFSQLSQKNSENVNKTLVALEHKERQLSKINTIMTTNDSTAVVTLVQTRQLLGESARVEGAEGTVVLSNSLYTLFGSDTSSELTEAGKAWLEKVAKIILAYPGFTTQVEGLNSTGEFETTFDLATAIAKELAVALQIPVERLTVTVKDGNFKEGIRIKLQPDYEGFYTTVKEGVKSTP